MISIVSMLNNRTEKMLSMELFHEILFEMYIDNNTNKSRNLQNMSRWLTLKNKLLMEYYVNYEYK